MTSSAPVWRFDGMSASAREAAEVAALGAGLSLSAWLTSLINDTCAAEAVAPRAAEAAPAPALAADSAPMPEASPDTATIDTTAIVMSATAAISTPERAAVEGATMLPVANIAPADLGTRRNDATPEALYADIAKRGVRTPLLVRRAAGTDNRYEIICGHRRWRAAQRAALAQVPAALCAHDDGQAILASLKENLQQGDLSPLDEAYAYLRLLTGCNVDSATVAQASGRDRQRIVRSLRLLGLPPRLRQMIETGSLSAAHADLLLDAPSPEMLADTIVAEQLSVDAARQRLGLANASEGTA